MKRSVENDNGGRPRLPRPSHVSRSTICCPALRPMRETLSAGAEAEFPPLGDQDPVVDPKEGHGAA